MVFINIQLSDWYKWIGVIMVIYFPNVQCTVSQECLSTLKCWFIFWSFEVFLKTQPPGDKREHSAPPFLSSAFDKFIFLLQSRILPL
jgi:hypothetical protein